MQFRTAEAKRFPLYQVQDPIRYQPKVCKQVLAHRIDLFGPAQHRVPPVVIFVAGFQRRHVFASGLQHFEIGGNLLQVLGIPRALVFVGIVTGTENLNALEQGLLA